MISFYEWVLAYTNNIPPNSSENDQNLHGSHYWKKKLFVKLCMLLENIYKDWWGQQSAKKASNQQKLYTILRTCLAMESSKIFVSFP